MSKGPSKKNGSVRNQSSEATSSSKPVLGPEEKNIEQRMESLAYEAVAIATQLKKSFNNCGQSFDFNNPIIQDVSRAHRILFGLIKDNKAKEDYESGK